MTGLTIPESVHEAAYGAYLATLRLPEHHGPHGGVLPGTRCLGVLAAVEAVAPAIVAAELRRIAAVLDTTPDPAGDRSQHGETAGRREVAGLLLGRAAVLDGES